jgi:hypothetical protein
VPSAGLFAEDADLLAVALIDIVAMVEKSGGE